ncbi:hypothetical protein VAR608DRAFT_3746 [Variovorax sp. HW608]|uniref:hypothetical protein n=1 Tax=Variovorax sp. HW608 TaxID=1034889 RepID=UPI00081FBDED|nr:hypothetical protein [Variovorax sp. HW608]SCK39834.1 hypothetical protein VAR608DRAFT_3746 [Variovorax sp. HW608]
MQLLRRIAAANRLMELIGTAEVKLAEEYERKGWVRVRRTRMVNSGDPDSFQTVYAELTEDGWEALREWGG